MDYKLIGSPCGEHGPYIFYKALKYNKNNQTNILALSEFFFVKLWTDSDLISIGELQLLWEDKNNEQTLASLRLYILPENTPDGRTDIHGEDEVLAISEKVVIRVEDLLTWITQATDWHWGLNAIWDKNCIGPPMPSTTPNIDMDDIVKEKLSLDESHWETNTGVVVLSYPRYCRYRGVIKRVEGVEDKWLRTSLVVALGGVTAPCKNTRILFCKDTFDYPDLEGHELLCNHLAPKLKGRPRKRKKTSMSPEASESESESSHSTCSSTSKVEFAKPAAPPSNKVGLVKPRLRCTLEVNKRTVRGPTLEEKHFLSALHNFMRERRTPITKIPTVGAKEVNLFKLYKKVSELGGYDMVTTGKLWKFVYEVMGGDMMSTCAATLSRRHYERLLLPYERHQNGSVKTPLSTPSTKMKPTLSLPPVPLPTRNTIHGVNNFNNTNNSHSNKNKHIVLYPAARNNRLKPDKIFIEKENIPQRRESLSKQLQLHQQQQQQQQQQQGKVDVAKLQIKPVSKQSIIITNKNDTEIIDLSEDSPVKVNPQKRAMSPMLKKQKLEILKEGGLEVTPVSAGGTGGRISVIKQSIVQPITIKHSTTQPSTLVAHQKPPQPAPAQTSAPPPPSAPTQPPKSQQSPIVCQPPPIVGGNKISITVTPDIDMSHLLSPSPGPSKRPIYGNPKELFQTLRTQQPEVLDLRTTKQKLNFGSNLEITLVESPKPPPPVAATAAATIPINILGSSLTKHQRQPSAPPPQLPKQQPTHHYRHQPAAAAVILPFTPSSSPNLPPNILHSGAAAAAATRNAIYPTTFKPAAAFLPAAAIDPSLYLSAIYGSMLSATSAGNFHNNNHHSNHHRNHNNNSNNSNNRQPTPTEQMYTELITRHGIFPAFVHDGSTSITLTTPTTK